MKESTPRGLDLGWIQNRVQEGYFGPLASIDRSIGFETAFNHSSLERIKEKRLAYRLQLVSGETKWSSQQELVRLQEEWKKIPKGGKEELAWTEDAVALTTTAFESFQQENGKPSFKMRDNQLYYLTTLLLNKGEYDWGTLETDSRGVQMHTGEGKTYGFGLAAGIMAFRGEQVHVIEPNYVSAENHAKQMAPFYEQFFNLPTGIVMNVPGKAGLQLSIDESTHTIHIGHIKEAEKSEVYEHGESREKIGQEGRAFSWSQQIVYTDRESVAFDYLRKKQIQSSVETGQPDLSRITALISEADEQMIDDARTPFIISESVPKGEVWDEITELFGLAKYFEGDGWTQDNKRETTKDVVFHLWYRLYDRLKKGTFIQGSGKDYFFENGRFVGSDRLSNKGFLIAVQALKPIFGCGSQPLDAKQSTRLKELLTYDAPLTEEFIKSKLVDFPEEEKQSMVEVIDWAVANQAIVDTALQVLLTVEENVDYIGKNGKTVLLDEYGFPLEKHQMRDISHLFLQMKQMWLNQQKEIDVEQFIILRETQSDKIDISKTKDRTTFPSLVQGYHCRRFSSGTLVPSAKLFHELYGAEVLAVDRHVPMPENANIAKENLPITCLDGGTAGVRFVSNKDRQTYLIQQAEQIKKKGTVGLFIVSSIEEANALHALIPSSVLATGQQELENRGTLDQVTSQTGQPGKLIITTWIAHRDIDVRLSDEVLKNGGLDCVVSGLLPSQRGLWQALQRSVRGDLPGSRTLVLSSSDFEAIKYNDLVGDSLQLLFQSSPTRKEEARVKKIDIALQKAIDGEKKSQEYLFREYLNYLSIQEDVVGRQLMFTYIRDGKLDRWKKIFMKHNGKFKTTGQSVIENPANNPDSQQKKRKRHQKHPNGTRTPELSTLWAEFIDQMEEDFTLFLMDPDIQKLTYEQIRSRYELHLYDMWGDGTIKGSGEKKS